MALQTQRYGTCRSRDYGTLSGGWKSGRRRRRHRMSHQKEFESNFEAFRSIIMDPIVFGLVLWSGSSHFLPISCPVTSKLDVPCLVPFMKVLCLLLTKNIVVSQKARIGFYHVCQLRSRMTMSPMGSLSPYITHRPLLISNGCYRSPCQCVDFK